MACRWIKSVQGLLVLLTGLYCVSAIAGRQSLSSTVEFNITVQAGTESHFQISSQVIPFSLQVWQGNRQIKTLEGVGSAPQLEFFALPISTDVKIYQVLVVPRINVAVNEMDFTLVDLSDTKAHLLLQQLEQLSAPQTNDNSVLDILNQLKITLEKLNTYSPLICATASKIASLEFRLGHFDRLVQQWDEAKKSLSEIQPNCLALKIFVADSYFSLNHFSSAANRFSELDNLLKLDTQIQSSPLLQQYIHLKSAFSKILNSISQGDEVALNQSKQELNTSTNLQGEYFPSLKPIYLNALATYLAAQGKYAESISSLQSAIEHNNTLGLADHNESILNNLAILYLRTGRLAEAQSTLRHSIRQAEQKNDHVALVSQTANLARTFYYLGDHKNAERYYRFALTRLTTNQTDGDGSLICIDLASLALDQLQPQLAQDWLNRAYHFANRHRPEKLSLISAMQSRAYSQLRQYEQSVDAAEKSIKQSSKISKAKDRISQLLTLAEAALDRQDTTEAALLIAQLDEMEISDVSRQLQLQHLAMRVLISDGNNSAVDKPRLNEHFMQAYEAVRHVAESLDFSRTGPQWMNQARKLLDTYLSVLLASDNIDTQFEAFQIFEYFQGTMFRASRQFFSNAVEEQSDTDHSDDVASGNIVTDQLNLVGALTYSQQQKHYMAMDKSRYEILKELGKTKQLNSFSRFLTLKDIQSALQTDEAALKYIQLEHNMVLIVFTAKDFYAIDLASISESVIDQQNRSPQEYLEFDALSVLPIENLIRAGITKLIISTDSALHKLAFSALNINANEFGYAPLISAFQHVEVPNISAYLEPILDRTDQFSDSFAIFTNPMFSMTSENKVTQDQVTWFDNLPSLDGSEMEIEAIQQAFPDSTMQVATGASATADFLLQESTRRAKILHIATHAYYAKDTPEIVGLVTAMETKQGRSTPGFLTLERLLNRPYYSQLVVLSGCDTALGELWQAEGLNSLTRQIMAQGAGSVISTLWKVADIPTSIFMQYFYQALRGQKNSASALRAAQNKMRSIGRYRHPKYWAGFVLTVANKHYETINLN